MKVLLTGRDGQLGQALVASAPEGVELVATSRGELDLADSAACCRIVEEQRPDWVLNAGAYTAVDQAEREPALAEAVNAQAPAAFAAALQQTGGRLLQLSTDFVFNGAQGHPYGPEQPRDPLGVYGASKARGEQAALQHPQARLLRTSWVYGPELAKAYGLLSQAARVEPITTADYPTPATRPSYSLLDCTASRQALGLPAVHWRDALAEVLARAQ